MAYFVYILQCKDSSLYTGATNNLKKRFREHNHTNRGARYTKYRRPVALVYFEECASFSHSRKREIQIKRLPRKAKLMLVQNFQPQTLS